MRWPRNTFGKPLLDAPRSETELAARAEKLAGQTLQALADHCDVTLPSDQLRDKGFVGQLVERALGASAGSEPHPDFELLGIELKTLPVDARGLPQETTFVTSLAPSEILTTPYAESRLKKKLTRVLWVPVEADSTLPLHARRIGSPLLWSPTEEEDLALAQDYLAFRARLAECSLAEIEGHEGRWLQIRPKQQARRPGEATARAFYLRVGFTRALIERHYLIGL